MSEEEFEDIFGNVPFENIKKIQKYIKDNYVSLGLYNKEKEKNKKAIGMLEEHIQHCEREAAGSLHNEVRHIALKFDNHLLDILEEE